MSSIHSKSSLTEINLRDGFECRYCGVALNEKTVVYNHLVPRSKGGQKTVENLVSSCARCNSLKYDFSYEQFVNRISHKLEKAEAEVEYYRAILSRSLPL